MSQPDSHRQTPDAPLPLFAVFLIACAAAALLCGYEFARSPSQTLFMAVYGKESLPAIMALMPLGVIAILYGYGRILSWLGARRTLLMTTLGSAAIILLCYGAIQHGFKLASAFLFIFREAYVVLIIEQYWSFLNSKLDHKSAQKFNGPICGVSSLGAIVGSLMVGSLAKDLGTGSMLLFAAGACIPAALLSDWAYRRGGDEPKPTPKESADEKHDHLGLALFRKNGLLVFLLMMILATQLVSTATGLAFNWELYDQIKDLDEQTAYSGNFQALVNGLSALFQFLVAPLLLRRLATRWVHVLLPAVQLGTCAFLLVSPSLLSASVAHLTFKVFDYSLFRAAKEILYIPFSYEVRYRSKELIDVFGYRFGKGAPSLVLTFVQNAGVALTSSAYGAISLVGVAIWLGLVYPIVRHVSPIAGEK